jgi:putative tricarboxylic transport membrane protein
VAAGAGGISDLSARTIQRIVQERKMAPVTFSVVDKPGGGGAVGWAYLNQQGHDGHWIATTLNNLNSNHILGRNPVRYSDLTPIAILSSAYIAFAVKADSDIASGKALVERLKRDPASVTIGVATALGGASHIAVGLALRSAGIDVRRLRVVVFDSGGKLMTALLGGHVQLAATPSPNAIGHMAAGKIRVLAVSAPHRLEGPYADTPTWTEQGADAVYAIWSGLAGPHGMPAEQVAYWDELLSRLVQTPEWQEALKRKSNESSYRNSAAATDFLRQDYEQSKRVLMELGLTK